MLKAMDIVIVPKIGIGPIKLGMSRDEVNERIQEYTDKYSHLPFSKNYFKKAFKVEYDSEDKVNFIEISSSIDEDFNCVYMEIPVFKVKAEELVNKLDIVVKYDRNHPEIGYIYSFPELGLTFWRPNILAETDLQESWFQELAADIQEDEMRNLYFSTVSISS